ncbi:DDE-type integrase/transposase/recombinase [Microbacterium esteraromaticum]|uniref:DDE-type integrase/transposase/recombinase n=1 Tax=Microbacterium esteraromaticum TaxID=57043 RepID=UPI0015C64630|nr:DDE-type integrase/transposase/recombinase [Microbacterium esteraromaticum]
MVKRSTRPHHSPTVMPEVVVAVVIATRRELVRQGKDSGPRSILDVLERSGFSPLPSRSTIARILDRVHLVKRNKHKRPKRSHTRIRSEFPNQRWQSDGLEVALTTGEIVVVVEILDDCTRYSIALHPGPAENSLVVVQAFQQAIAGYGRPVVVHTDNGTAFNQRRANKTSALDAFLSDLGVKMISGRPRHPQSQGKVERAHQTLLNFIDARRPATIEQLQQILDEYRDWFNHHRSHQSLPPRTAPADLYDTLPKIAPPGDPITPPNASRPASRPVARQERYNAIIQQRTASGGGRVRYLLHVFILGKAWHGQRITILRNDDTLDLFDSAGELITTTPWPASKAEMSLTRQIDHTPPHANSPLSPETEPSTKS